MSIADKITRLQTAKTNIATAITNKGGTVSSGDGFEDFSSDIATIQTGITPTGTISITENGTHDVANYSNASVNVESFGEFIGIFTGYYEGSGYGSITFTVSKVGFYVARCKTVTNSYNRNPALIFITKNDELSCTTGACSYSFAYVNTNTPILSGNNVLINGSTLIRFTTSPQYDLYYIGDLQR